MARAKGVEAKTNDAETNKVKKPVAKKEKVATPEKPKKVPKTSKAKSTSSKKESDLMIFQNLTGGNGHKEQVLNVGSYKVPAGGSREFVSSVGNALLKSPQIKAMIKSNYLQVVTK